MTLSVERFRFSINKVRSSFRTKRIARKNERGFFTIWTLGLCVGVLFLGGLIFDFWHAFSDRRELAAMVDAAAVAGANQVDLDAFRVTGQAQLDEAAARQAIADYLATASATNKLQLSDTTVEIQGQAIAVTSTVSTRITFAAIFLASTEVPVTVTGIADPRVAQ